MIPKTTIRCIVLGYRGWLPVACLLFLALGWQAAWAIECLDSGEKILWQLDADQPSDLAVGPDGRYYLVDGVNHRILVLNSSGKVTATFGTFGTGPGQLNAPMGIDIMGREVFVADTGNHRIQIFDLTGRHIRQFKVPSGPGEKPSDPVDVLASGLKDHIYVSDNDNHKIKVFDAKGRYRKSWGGFGEEAGEFRYPAMLAVNSSNEVLVVDVLNTRVQKFDPFGNHMTEIGGWGVTAGKLMRPKGVALDSRDRVYVSDSYLGVVQVFTDQGRLLGVICHDRRIHRLTTPVGLTATADGRFLSIVEMQANRIHRLKLQHR